MPTIETETLKLELPSDWLTFADGNLLVAQGSSGEEVILSRSKVIGYGSDGERDQIISLAKERLIESIRRTAANPELITAAPESQSIVAEGVSIIRCSSVSRDQEVQFEQFGIIIPPELVLVTYEAPPSASRSLAMLESSLEAAIRSRQ